MDWFLGPGTSRRGKGHTQVVSDTTQSFWQRAGRVLNAGQTRTVLLTGNIYDLFEHRDRDGGVAYVPMVNLLTSKWALPDLILVVYELNGPVRFLRDEDQDAIRDAWLKFRTGMDADDLAIRKMLSSGKFKADLETMSKAFSSNLKQAVGNPTVALELLRQMCLCSRATVDGAPVLTQDLVILIEAADMAVPGGEINRLSDADRHRISICQDWFSDPGFMDGADSVVLIAESRSMINSRIARLPQILEVEVPSPGQPDRQRFIEWFDERHKDGGTPIAWAGPAELAVASAGLSLHALRQLLTGARYAGHELTQNEVVRKVEDFIKSQVGEDVVEFKKPGHTLDDIVGFANLKRFLRDQLLPRFQSTGPDALPGAAVCGPIGGGKTFIFEAVAAELDMVVLVLKNIRSQWYGQTDVIFERLQRVLVALNKVLIFVDEADTQFGGVGADAHATERRLTGKIQAMMSDVQLRGKVIWLLMTARIHLLSPDIRRPGRVGDLIIPVLDPAGEDRQDFLRWMVQPVARGDLPPEAWTRLEQATEGLFAASYASMRAELKAQAAGTLLDIDDILRIVEDHLSPNIGPARRYQTLQALLNCTRRSLLPDPDIDESDREQWAKEIRTLEMRGVE